MSAEVDDSRACGEADAQQNRIIRSLYEHNRAKTAQQPT